MCEFIGFFVIPPKRSRTKKLKSHRTIILKAITEIIQYQKHWKPELHVFLGASTTLSMNLSFGGESAVSIYQLTSLRHFFHSEDEKNHKL